MLFFDARLRVVTCFFEKLSLEMRFGVKCNDIWAVGGKHSTSQCYDIPRDHKLCNTNENRNTRLISAFHFVPLFGNSETVTAKNVMTSGNTLKQCTVTLCYIFFQETFSRDAFWSQM